MGGNQDAPVANLKIKQAQMEARMQAGGDNDHTRRELAQVIEERSEAEAVQKQMAEEYQKQGERLSTVKEELARLNGRELSASWLESLELSRTVETRASSASGEKDSS